LQKLGRMDRKSFIFPSHTGLIPHGRECSPHSIVWQLLLAVACILALGFLQPQQALAQIHPGETASVEATEGAQEPPLATMAAPTATLVTSEANSTRLVIQFPVEQPPSRWQDVTADRLAWVMPGLEGWDQEGEAFQLPPVHRVNVAVPCRVTPRWRVVDTKWWRNPEAEVDPHSLVEVSPPNICRDVSLVTVTVNPLAEPGGLLASLTLVLDHPPAGVCIDHLRLGIAAKAELRNRPSLVPGAVLNPELFRTLCEGARQWRIQYKSAKQDDEGHPFALTANWLRLEVEQTGVYRLGAFELSLLGVPTNDVDPAKLRLFKGGGQPLDPDPELPDSVQAARIGLNEVAILVRDEDDGWDSTDDFLFYGFGGDVWLDRFDPAAPPLAHFEHPYAGRGIYWLTWEDYSSPSPFAGMPRRVPELNPIEGGESVTSHQARLHREQSNIEWTGHLLDNWAWDTAVFDSKIVTFDIPSTVAGSQAQFVMDIRSVVKRRTSHSYLNHAVAWLNDDLANAANADWMVGHQDDSLRVRIVGSSDGIRSGTNSFTLRNDNIPDGIRGALAMVLDSFDILYWSQLAKGATQLPVVHWDHQVSAPGDTVNMKIQVPSPTSLVKVWDVTRPDSALALRGTVSAEPDSILNIGLVRDPTNNRHLVVFSENDLLSPATHSVFDYKPRSLRTEIGPADYVVVYDPVFRSAALMLGNLRASQIPGYSNPIAIAVNEEDIYDNFSGGLKDPYALRNFLKWLYQKDNRLAWVCWMGDASRDYRNYLGHDPATQLYDFVPTVVRHYFPALPQIGYSTEPYATDEELVSFDRPLPGSYMDQPDLISGRLTVVNSSEAVAAVQRIADYTNQPEPGLWRNRVVLVADDLETPSGPESGQHMRQSENIVNLYLPKPLDVEKIYLVDYEKPPGSSNKPGARQEAKQLLNQGTTIFHYVGHGSNAALADEQVLLIEDIYSLNNDGRRGAFIAFSCDVGIYESPVTQSMAEIFVAQPDGGAIAAICASQVSWSTYNDQLSYAFYRNMYEGRAISLAQTLGKALWDAKIDIGNEYGQYLGYMQNAHRYLLFGDPASRLPHPVTGVVFAPASPDSLRGGIKETVIVDLVSSGINPGPGVAYDLRVEESRQHKSATGTTTVYYWLPGAAVFRGAGEVSASELRIPFKVPTQLRYGDSGRVRVVVTTPEGEWAGADSIPVVTADIGEVDDVVGPDISLSFEENRYRVRAGTMLHAELQDTSGVSILGTNPSNSVLLEFDESGFMTNVSEAFIFDPGSYTSGQVAIPLPGDLALGNHTAALHASDVLGNVGNDTLSFLLVAEGVAGIEDVTVYPNPTPGPCRLIFELSDPMHVEWNIFTLAGRRIKYVRQKYDTAGPKVIPWDGRDQYGDEIANGVYLFVLRGSPEIDGGRDVQKTGQLVIMK